MSVEPPMEWGSVFMATVNRDGYEEEGVVLVTNEDGCFASGWLVGGKRNHFRQHLSDIRLFQMYEIDPDPGREIRDSITRADAHIVLGEKLSRWIHAIGDVKVPADLLLHSCGDLGIRLVEDPPIAMSAYMAYMHRPKRVDECTDCGEKGETIGHMGCQYPQDRP
jgi:hypothetical protein